ncbi:MAG: hypothetical protein ACKOGH_05490, partial [Alphaproteobacteria bacterium]
MDIEPGPAAKRKPRVDQATATACQAMRQVLQLPPWMQRPWPFCAPRDATDGIDPRGASTVESMARAARALRIIAEQGAGGAWWGSKPVLPGASLETLVLVGGTPGRRPEMEGAGILPDGGMERVVVLLAADTDRAWRRVLADWRSRGAVVQPGQV